MSEQIFTIGRDVDFSVFLQNADGSAMNITGMSFRLRIYPESGRDVAPVIDVSHGTGITTGDAAGGRMDIAAGQMPSQDPSYGGAELTRIDTGADRFATWPCKIVRPGTVIDGEQGDIVIRNASNVVLRVTGTTPGIQGPQGNPGISSIATGIVPLFPNGDFALWGRGTGPFDATGIIAEGVRFTKGAGSTHAIARGAPITPASDYSLEWDRTVAGSGTSSLLFRIEDIRRLHGKTFLFAFDHLAAAGSIPGQTLMTMNYGSGGSPADTWLAQSAFTATTSPGSTSRNAAIDLTGKTIGPNNFLEVTIRRLTTQADGKIWLGNLRAWFGTTDFGMPPIAPAIRDQMCRRRLQIINTRTINGTTRVYFPVSMRAIPAVTATVGTISNITTESCDLTHTSAASTVLTCDAEI